jgi:hypothetical protein
MSHCILGRPGRKSTVENSTLAPIQPAPAMLARRVADPAFQARQDLENGRGRP